VEDASAAGEKCHSVLLLLLLLLLLFPSASSAPGKVKRSLSAP
jgi:hypothetical protein